ncbi:MAG TPA: aminotransferase class I/II-fold pyridoxal phosphate-dependent enzyme, partial [Pseudonocardiaceae bacterium]|nr:aminotransferase class I/II-fold pyridoxal phosphate-dependent enzyme [Pseudonocardiaceae bacterium]
MVEQTIARRAVAVQQALQSYSDTVLHSQPHNGRPIIADLLSGDPQELPPHGFAEALRRFSIPTSRDWFAYRFAHQPARQAAAHALTAELGVGVAYHDIFLTRGAAGAIALALHTVVDPGDEVLFISPPWFFYEAMILSSGATPIRVRLRPPAFDLDIDAIMA